MAKPYVLEYQPTDEQGNPIGTPTHFEADSPEEMFEKQKAAHISATQALYRQNQAFDELAKRKITPKVVEQPIKPKELTADETNAAFMEMQTPTTVTKGLKTIVEAITPVTEVRKELDELKAEREAARIERDAKRFLANHKTDYYQCEANTKSLADYLEANNLAFTTDNLEVAYVAQQSKLATKPAAPPVAANNGNTEVTNNGTPNNPPTQVKRPADSIRPSQFTGTKPLVPGGLSRKAIMEMARNNPQEYKRRLKDPTLRAEIDAVLNT